MLFIVFFLNKINTLTKIIPLFSTFYRIKIIDLDYKPLFFSVTLNEKQKVLVFIFK